MGRKRKQVSEADRFGAAAAAAAATGWRGVKSRRLSMTSKESGEISSSGGETCRSSNAFSTYEEFKKTAGQDRPQVSFSLSGATRTTQSVDLSNNSQSNPLDDDSSEEDGEIAESSDASTSMSESESSSEEDSEAESDSAPSHARASASPNNTHRDREGDASTMAIKPHPDGMIRLHQLTDKEQDEQYKYFDLRYDDDIIYCMCCGDRGHQARTCPTRRCTHCNAYDKHASHACPTFRKCTRCRQRGHDAPQCTNTQPIIIGNDTCDICSEQGHVEEECAKLWHTSLNPPLKEIAKTAERDMYKVCYHCGDSGYDSHWGDDCPDRYYDERTQGPNLVKTWGKKDAAKFVEPESNNSDVDEEEEREDSEVVQKMESDEPAPAASQNWQVGLFDY